MKLIEVSRPESLSGGQLMVGGQGYHISGSSFEHIIYEVRQELGMVLETERAYLGVGVSPRIWERFSLPEIFYDVERSLFQRDKTGYPQAPKTLV